jgi:hypothetical protein
VARARGEGCARPLGQDGARPRRGLRETLRPDGATVESPVAVQIGVGIGTALVASPAVRVKFGHDVGVRRAGAYTGAKASRDVSQPQQSFPTVLASASKAVLRDVVLAELDRGTVLALAPVLVYVLDEGLTWPAAVLLPNCLRGLLVDENGLLCHFRLQDGWSAVRFALLGTFLAQLQPKGPLPPPHR